MPLYGEDCLIAIWFDCYCGGVLKLKWLVFIDILPA